MNDGMKYSEAQRIRTVPLPRSGRAGPLICPLGVGSVSLPHLRSRWSNEAIASAGLCDVLHTTSTF